MLDVKKCSRHGLAALAMVLSACTDGATRIAYDIEAGIGAFRRSGAASYSIKHAPEAEPDGLRVCDASVFPNLPCANTNPPTMMTGECVAACIFEESP